ncbi:DUF1028 domain-containing protein [Runella slithyformis]|uniref:DUF1028 domain-containing protein n=1 Tax=Runella slithyformis (strain ATCC 29530 / DSM 19594 / LMG 11500 / NCIMB 11436 / LSU 4) TaxID=761193 RepID=A0A7U3ZGS6_RUNSL|nr:DUF1028 domain-containing protein [Runella slithyformis]AEI46852.1 protein of unknown function DUF1028 [Runella slithyformis DSM 19594]
MRNSIFLFVFLGLIFSRTHAQFFKKDNGLAHTFSIVARDEKTGEIAVGVQSHWFSVGTSVSWAEAGVGAVATQSFTNKSFGVRGLALLKSGKTAHEALDILLSDDAGREVRQVGIVDAKGNVANFTGKNCVDFAGDLKGKNYAVQSNMMLTDAVPAAMAKSFEANAQLPLAERVLEALKAAQKVGGDIRGKQSAVLLVVKGEATDKPWDDNHLVDLRVDDHPEPLAELQRLLTVQRAYDHMNNGDLAVEKNDMPLAMKEYGAAMKMFPGNLEMQYWTAITLANNGDIQKAALMLKAIYAKEPNWRKMTQRLPKAGLLTVKENELKILVQ